MVSDRSNGLRQQLATVRERLDVGMGRREYLRTLGSAGYALGMAHVLGVDDFLAVDDGEVPVVTALVREDSDDPWSVEPRTTTVPASWYAAVERAFDVNDVLARTHLPGYLGSAVAPGDYRSGATVTVGVSANPRSIKRAIRDIVDDVSIDVEQIEDVEDSQGIDELTDDPESVEPRILDGIGDGTVPGGISVETETSLATLGPALYDPDGERTFFSTAEHAFDTDDDLQGEPVVLPVDGEGRVEIGTVAYDHPVEDIVAVEPSGPIVPASRIDASSPIPVLGQFTKYGLADLIARDEPLEKVGAMTGHTTGYIQGIEAITCFTDDFCRRGQIRWGAEMDLIDGDSGSVSYHSDPHAPDEGVLVAGLNNARTWWPGQSYVWGVAAYRLTDLYGYHF